jgi:hypothetical protein
VAENRPLVQAFEAVRLRLLEQLGGDARFRGLRPVRPQDGRGLVLDTDDASRLELVLREDEAVVAIAFLTHDRESFAALLGEGAGAGEADEGEADEGEAEAQSARLESCLERVGLHEAPPVEIARGERGQRSGFRIRCPVSAEELATPEGGDRLRFLLEGVWLAYPRRLRRP